jgi:hypothetical protein
MLKLQIQAKQIKIDMKISKNYKPKTNSSLSSVPNLILIGALIFSTNTPH